MPSELADDFVQYPIEGRMEPVESPTLRISAFSIRDMRAGLVSMSALPENPTAQSCNLDYEFTFVHGLQNSWITTCKTNDTVTGTTLQNQSLRCDFKPLAGRPWRLSLSGQGRDLMGEIESDEFTNQLHVQLKPSPGALISSQGLNIGAVSLNRPGFLRVAKGLGLEEKRSMVAVALSLALRFDRFKPEQICLK